MLQHTAQLYLQDENVVKVTSSIYLSQLKCDIALVMVSTEFFKIGTSLQVDQANLGCRARFVEYPLCEPKKKIAAS